MEHPSIHATKSDPAIANGVRSIAPELSAQAIVFEGNKQLSLRQLDLITPCSTDLIVDVDYSGVSTGTERLLWSGEMPSFPGMGYPLVPGYESVGRVVKADGNEALLGRYVFTPGAHCYQSAHGLFGASSSRLVIAAERVTPIDFENPEHGVLLALAATAYHAIAGGAPPDLIVGHGVLGRLLARITIALGAPAPVVWEVDPARADGEGYAVIEPECDGRNDYSSIYDVSGDVSQIDDLIMHSAKGGELILAGFYTSRPSFAFPPAFMKEIRLRIAAEWAPSDLDAVLGLISIKKLSLDGLITHRTPATDAKSAYETAFSNPECLKMILDWRGIT